MKFPQKDHRLTGAALPISALKSQDNLGYGEFLDLIPLGRWCAASGIELIQVLPVNDTGYETSPYSALSAFALHPAFIRLDALPGAGAFKKEIQSLKEKFQARKEAPHQEVLGAKWEIFKKIWAAEGAGILKDPAFEKWLKDNPWTLDYSVFCALKYRNNLSAWQTWPEMRTPTRAQIQEFWKTQESETRFFAWLQFEAEKQLLQAAQELDRLGVALKGDLPILLNDESADVWASPDLFDLSCRAGAPPMGGSDTEGQNWGFPTYRWENHRKDGFTWWKNRLLQANKFYHAYRIDHVVGFFRIWATPESNYSAVLGHFEPSRTISKSDLYNIGFDDGRITWMSVPHIPGHELRHHLGPEADGVQALVLDRVGQEDLFRFKAHITGEKVIGALGVSDRAKGQLMQWFRNRTLIEQSPGQYLPNFLYLQTRGWNSLNDGEKHVFGQVIHRCLEDSEKLWESQGSELMDIMKTTAPMLVCAEDLGSVPDCVPVVLPKKSILGLKIVRWARAWKESGCPFIPVKDYPLLSVCTPAVHDTSTVRQWWTEEADRDRFFREALGREPLQGPYTPETARQVIQGLLEAPSYLCIFQLQDLLALKAAYWTEDPNDERVNLPGTVSKTNWCYKMKPSLEDLTADKEFSTLLLNLTQDRRGRKASV